MRALAARVNGRGVERIHTTLWELLSVANEIASDEREAAAIVASLLASHVLRSRDRGSAAEQGEQ